MISKRSIFSGIAGNVLEWYDFFIYVSLSPILAKVFYPHKSHGVGVMIALALFAVGFLMRPLGAVFFGYWGDKYGRKNSLLFSIVLMVLATLALGILPTGEGVIVGTVSVLLCRLCQGFSAGGELTGSMVFVVEHAPKQHRGYFGSFVFLGTFLGILLGSLMGWLLNSSLTASQLQQWGWRVAFIFGALLGGVVFYLRQKAQETPYFKQHHVEEKRKPYNKKTCLCT